MTLLPELILLFLALLVLGLDLALPEKRRGLLGWLTAIGAACAAAAAIAVAAGWAGSPAPIATLTADGLAAFFRVLVLGGLALAALLSIESEGVGRRGEYYALLLFSAIGMCLMAAAADLVILALAVELTAVPLYVLAGFLKRDSRSTEAGMKYFLFGATASAVMIYGFSLLYGLTGQTDLRGIAAALTLGGGAPAPLLLAACVLVLAGLGFKVAAVPFHFWAPDVYEGAPTPVAGFLSTASKAAAFCVLARIALWMLPPDMLPYTGALLAVMSAVTMTLGNLLALAQKNMKRLLAYSSIAHAGYALIGLVAGTPEGAAATAFYLAVYLATNLAAFGLVVVVARASGTDDVAGFAGLSRRSPGLALVTLITFLSLAGMPPFGGFMAKLFIFAAAVQAGLVWLAIVGVINAILGLYYYLLVLKVVYLYRSEEETAGESGKTRIRVPAAAVLALSIACLAILLLGIFAAPGWEWSWQAARSLFPG